MGGVHPLIRRSLSGVDVAVELDDPQLSVDVLGQRLGVRGGEGCQAVHFIGGPEHPTSLRDTQDGPSRPCPGPCVTAPLVDLHDGFDAPNRVRRITSWWRLQRWQVSGRAHSVEEDGWGYPHREAGVL